MTDFKKHAKKILQELGKEYEVSKEQFKAKPGFSSSSALRKKLKEHEKKIDQTKQDEDDILGE